MNKPPIFILVVILFTVFIPPFQAQTWQWAKSGSNGGSDGTTMCTDNNGNVFISGTYSGTFVAGNYILTGGSAYFVKYDANGSIVWAKSNITNVANTGYAYGASSDASGNTYFTGSFGGLMAFGSYTLNAPGYGSLYLVKFDPNGTVLWAVQPVSGYNSGSGVACDPSGNVFVTGNNQGTSVFGNDTLTTNNGSPNVLIAKYSPSGNVLWATTSQGDMNDGGNSITCDGSGNAYITGVFTSSVITFGTHTVANTAAQNFFTAKYNANGVAQWASSGAASGIGSRGFSISHDRVGSVYVTGEIEGTSMVVGSDTLLNPQGGNGPTVMFLIRYDLNGNAIWAIQSGTAAAVSSFACSAFLNHIWVSGPMPYVSPITFGSYTINPVVNPQDATTYIVRFDSTGTATYGQGLGGGGDDYFGISVYDSCHVYISGDLGGTTSFGSYTLSATPEFAFVAKLFFPCSNIDGLNESSLQSNKIVLYPNPNSGTFVLKNEVDWENQEISLINPIGQEVYRQKVSGNTSEINSKLKPGLYFYKLFQSNKIVSTGKLIVD